MHCQYEQGNGCGAYADCVVKIQLVKMDPVGDNNEHLIDAEWDVCETHGRELATNLDEEPADRSPLDPNYGK